jgi:hypothetical protein
VEEKDLHWVGEGGRTGRFDVVLRGTSDRHGSRENPRFAQVYPSICRYANMLHICYSYVHIY